MDKYMDAGAPLGDDMVIDAEVTSETTAQVMPPLRHEMIAADGGRLPSVASTGGQLIDILEDGQFSADVGIAARRLIAAMKEIEAATSGKGKVKGELNVNIAFTLEDGLLKISSSYKTKTPELPRPKSVLWTDDRNNFTRFPPGQSQFFGLKSANGDSSGNVREV